MATVGWAVLQVIGAWFVGRVVSRAGNTYGVFAVVIGLLVWLSLLARAPSSSGPGGQRGAPPLPPVAACVARPTDGSFPRRADRLARSGRLLLVDADPADDSST